MTYLRNVSREDEFAITLVGSFEYFELFVGSETSMKGEYSQPCSIAGKPDEINYK
jgi:hypothetical protein